jgi:hypothetical protein
VRTRAWAPPGTMVTMSRRIERPSESAAGCPCGLSEPDEKCCGRFIRNRRRVKGQHADAVGIEWTNVEVAHASSSAQVMSTTRGRCKVSKTLGPALAGRDVTAVQYFPRPVKDGEQGDLRCSRDAYHTIFGVERL